MRRSELPAAAGLAASAAAALCALGPVLARAAGTPLEEIVVTSTRLPTPIREVGTDVSVIGGDEIRLRGYASMADVLRTQPGVAVTDSGGLGKNTTLRIRGEDGYRTLVLIDGVKIADPTTPQAGPSFDHLLATGDLERVEILRGPQGFIYGADAGGVVNVITRQGAGPPSGQLGLETGSYATRRLEGDLAGGGQAGDYFVSATEIASAGFNSQTADTVLQDRDGYRNRTLHAKLGWNVAPGARLQLVAHSVSARSQFDGCGYPAVYDCIGKSRQTTYRVSADVGAGPLSQTLAYSDMEAVSRSYAAGTSTFATDGGLARAEYTGRYRPRDGLAFVFGIDWQRERIRGDADAATRDQRAYYVEYQGRVGRHFFVSAGSRMDVNASFGRHASARLTAAYVHALASGVTVKYRASYGTGFRAPSLFELAYDRGPAAFPPAAGRDLGAESSAGVDAGLDVVWAGGASMSATWFDQRIEDEIYFDAAAFSGYLQARGTDRSRGLELAFTLPVSRRWQLLGNFTYDETRDPAGLPRLRRPKDLANLGFRYAAPGSKLALLGDYRLARHAVDEVFGRGRVPLDDYGVLDISAALTLRPRLELYVRGENLTDRVYREVVGFNTAGRTLAAGVRLTF